MSALKWCPINFLKTGLLCQKSARCKKCVETAIKEIDLPPSIDIKKINKFYNQKQSSNNTFLLVNHEDLPDKLKIAYLRELVERARDSVK